MTSPAVLIPGLDLCVSQLKMVRQLFPFVHAQVFLSDEAAFEHSQLCTGKRRSRFARLFTLSAPVVRY